MNTSIDYLQKLGLTYYEAKIVMLLFTRRASALEISSLAGVPYTKIYRVLRGAEARGIKVSYLCGAKARIYKKLHPAKIISTLIKKKQAEVDALAKRREIFLQVVSSAPAILKMERAANENAVLLSEMGE